MTLRLAALEAAAPAPDHPGAEQHDLIAGIDQLLRLDCGPIEGLAGALQSGVESVAPTAGAGLDRIGGIHPLDLVVEQLVGEAAVLVRPTVELANDLDIGRHQKVQRVAVLGKSASVQLRTFSGPSAQGGSPVGGGR